MAWAEYTPDANKTVEENAQAKAEHDKTKPADPPKQEAPAPLTKDSVKLPEGFEADDETMGKFVDLLNDDKKTPAERAQGLIDLQAEVMKKGAEKSTQDFLDTQKQWQDAVKADKDIGGEKLDPALGRISQLIDTHDRPDKLREAFEVTGMGNHPEMIRFLDKIAARLAEGGITPGGLPSTKKSVAERMYPSMKG